MRHDPLLIIIIALAVVAAMAFHGINFNHDHHGETGSGIHAYLHGHDKKLFVLAAILQIFLLALILIPLSRSKKYLELNLLGSRPFSPLIL